jgi:hypothetical protein
LENGSKGHQNDTRVCIFFFGRVFDLGGPDHPISCKTLGKFFDLDGKRLEEQYLAHLSGFTSCNQKEHANDWILFPENIGEHLSIDETSSLSQGELYTIVTNKAKKGQKVLLRRW